jgi:Zn-dependent M28 family amino/carboxypeptidase
MSRNVLTLSTILLLGACGSGEDATPYAGSSSDGPGFHVDLPGADQLSEARLREGIATLAADEFEGRSPSSPGEELTVAYLIQEFEAAGLEPGNEGSWTQDVPLVSITVAGSPSMTVSGHGTSTELEMGRDFTAGTKRVVDQVSLDESEMVFVGYGIVAPEYGWNDYEGLDMAGKTAVILVNDPGYATQDEALFRGFAMTYYGRWTYKYEEAARQGAAGAIVVHETGPAGYPWGVVETGWTGPQFGLVAEDNNMSRAAVESWITMDVATDLFAKAGLDYEELRDAAAVPGFAPVPLGLSASVTLENEIERSTSQNVIAMIPGSERPDEYVIYAGHWDHLGVSPDESLEDRIYNGGLDNATGTSALLELARAFKSLDAAPARSVVFMPVTAEEQGLLGSEYYASNPVFPTSQTVAAINIDGLNIHGSMRDLVVVGYGASELDAVLEEWASSVGRVLRPDPEAEKGFYYRSDHFNFAKVGIPALYTDAGIDHVVHGEEWTLARREEYTAQNYHQPSDEYDPAWDLAGAMDDLHLYYAVGYDLANSDAWPNWREGNEFKAARDADRPGS